MATSEMAITRAPNAQALKLSLVLPSLDVTLKGEEVIDWFLDEERVGKWGIFERKSGEQCSLRIRLGEVGQEAIIVG